MAAHKALALSATLAVAVLSAMLLLLPGANPVEAKVNGVLDAHCRSTLDFNSGFAGGFRAQTFTAAHSGKLTDARATFSRLKKAKGVVRVQIRTLDPSGAPSSTVLASTGIPRTDISSGPFRTATAHFARTSAARVIAGRSYALVMKAPDGFYVAGTSSGCPGTFYFAPSSGSPYQETSGDLLFAVFVAAR